MFAPIPRESSTLDRNAGLHVNHVTGIVSLVILPTRMLRGVGCSKRTDCKASSSWQWQSPSCPTTSHQLDNMADHDSSHVFTCISCAVAFNDPALQRQHFASDWHRYNMKVSSGLCHFSNILANHDSPCSATRGVPSSRQCPKFQCKGSGKS